LSMNETSLYHRWNNVVRMNKLFKFSKRNIHLCNRWWHKTGIVWTSATYPILTFAKFAGISEMSPSCFIHKYFMEFSYKTERDGEIIFGNSIHTIIKSFDIMQNI